MAITEISIQEQERITDFRMRDGNPLAVTKTVCQALEAALDREVTGELPPLTSALLDTTAGTDLWQPGVEDTLWQPSARFDVEVDGEDIRVTHHWRAGKSSLRSPGGWHSSPAISIEACIDRAMGTLIKGLQDDDPETVRVAAEHTAPFGFFGDRAVEALTEAFSIYEADPQNTETGVALATALGSVRSNPPLSLIALVSPHMRVQHAESPHFEVLAATACSLARYGEDARGYVQHLERTLDVCERGNTDAFIAVGRAIQVIDPNHTSPAMERFLESLSE